MTNNNYTLSTGNPVLNINVTKGLVQLPLHTYTYTLVQGVCVIGRGWIVFHIYPRLRALLCKKSCIRYTLTPAIKTDLFGKRMAIKVLAISSKEKELHFRTIL